MSIDLGIGTISTTLTASDPELFKSDEFRMQVQQIVREEMAREKELSKRRAHDMRGLREAK